MSTSLASVKATVHGRVQGIGFRYFTARYAQKLSLTGYVRNLTDGTVEVEAEGERAELEKLVEYLGVGTTGARVDRVEVNWLGYSGRYADFSIKR